MSNIEVIRGKIVPFEELKHIVARLRFKGKRVVFTNGCFDLLHLGHIDYLAKAADEGDVLIVGLNTDASTKRLKGQDRPVNDQEQRSMLLAALHFVDHVVLFDEDTPLELIKAVAPDVLVKGADYTPEKIIGADVVLAQGGKVKTIEFLKGYSSSSIIERIKMRQT